MSATPAFDFIPEPLARYRFHPGTMMKDDLRARTRASTRTWATSTFAWTSPCSRGRRFAGPLLLPRDSSPAYLHLALSFGGWR